MKVAIILGTRPQIIKSAPVYEAFEGTGIECQIINTGQHYDYEMNREFFSELRLPEPAADLGVGQGTPNEQISGIIEGLGRTLGTSSPELAIVPGDTNSALAAGVACSKAGVRIAHLESGCRSGDLRMPEEVNRRLVDHMSQVLLCPTQPCMENLEAEHVLADVVANVGDTMYDSLLKFRDAIENVDIEGRYNASEGSYAFMTLHRAEAVDDPRTLGAVMKAVGSLETQVIFSVHPRTKARLAEFGIRTGSNLKLMGPLPYVDTLALVKGSQFVMTDSGGLQKEAFWLGKPTLITRDRTEWNEIVRAGASFIVGTTAEGISRGFKKIGHVDRRSFSKSKKIFGNGDASKKVVRAISKYLSSM